MSDIPVKLTAATAPATPARPRPAVLLVDDETELSAVLAEAMAGEFAVETVASAAEAETALGRWAFDVVVCDHLMPGEQGLDFFVRHYGRWPATRRILLTGYMNPELISRSVSVAGLAACVLKPLTPSELAQAVRAALAG